MNNLKVFQPPPMPGQQTQAEINSHLVTEIPPNLVPLLEAQLANFPTPQFSADHQRPPVCQGSVEDNFVEIEESWGRKLFTAWFQQGIEGVLEELSTPENGTMGRWTRVLHTSLTFAKKTIRSLQNLIIGSALQPNDALVAKFSLVLNWGEGQIRHLAWHPQTCKFAVCLRDDSIRIYSQNRNIIPLLENRLQRGVVQMAWMPNSSSVLAVACQTGVLIWNISPKSLATRPASSNLTCLRHQSRQPVTTIEWHPHGLYLVSASAFDNSIYIWDVATEQPVTLTRYAGGGTVLLKFSPDATRLLTVTTSSLFMIWETDQWTCQTHRTQEDDCIRTACWGPNGTLLYVCDQSPVLYCLVPDNAIPVVSLESVCFPRPMAGSEIWVGGQVLNMVWDKHMERLAIAFKEHPQLVVVFRTCYGGATLTPVPCGFIQGAPGEMVQHLVFCNAFKEGALLTICWSSGRIKHIPFLFTPVHQSSSSRMDLSVTLSSPFSP